VDRKRVHNLKYYTWVEQQGKTYEEIQAQWYDPNRNKLVGLFQNSGRSRTNRRCHGSVFTNSSRSRELARPTTNQHAPATHGNTSTYRNRAFPGL
jgi:hypothetical protein